MGGRNAFLLYSVLSGDSGGGLVDKPVRLTEGIVNDSDVLNPGSNRTGSSSLFFLGGERNDVIFS